MLQQGFRRSSAQNRGFGGDVRRLKSGEPAAIPTAVGVQKTETTWLGPPLYYRKHIATREVSPYPGEKSAVFTVCYANAHAAIGESTCTKLARGLWVTGGV